MIAAQKNLEKSSLLLYRGILSWIDDPNGAPLVEPDTSWEDHCWKRYRIFLDVYHRYEIRLDKETYKRIQAFEQTSREVMGKFSIPRAVNESEDERRATWDALRRDVLAPKLDELSDALRAEMQATPTTILWRLVLHAVERIERKPNPR